MIRYIVKRLLLMIPVILGVTWLIFTIMYFTPGDPARIILGTDASEAEIAALQEDRWICGPLCPVRKTGLYRL